MNASQISGNMKTQVFTLDEIKKLYDRAVKDKLASEKELEALKAYIDSIDEPWHVMAKIAESIAQAEKDSKAKKEEKPKDDAKAAKTDAKAAKAKEAAKQESLVDEAQDEEPVDAEADDDLSFLD